MRWFHFIKISLFLGVLFVAPGCCRAGVNAGQFQQYVVAFQKEAVKFHRDVIADSLTIQSGSLPAGTLALCTLGNGIPLITVSPDYWPKLTEQQREMVLFHELGHCLLGKIHENETRDVSGERAYRSLMYLHPLDIYDYSQFHDDYMTELFATSGPRG